MRSIAWLLLLGSTGCAAKSLGVALGSAAGAAVGVALSGCPTLEPGEPPPDGRRLTDTGGAIVGGVIGGAAGFALATLLQQEEEGRLYERGRVLVLIALATPQAMDSTARALAQGRGVALEQVAPLPLTGDGLIMYRITDGSPVLSKLLIFRSLPDVRGAWPDYIYRVQLSASEVDLRCAPSAQQAAPLDYGARLIRADRLRSSVTGRGVRIALIDTGLDPSHDALRAAIADTIDLTGTGFSADVHATMVGGVIAARATGGARVDGVAPDARLVAIKACTPERPAQAPARCRTSLLSLGVDRAMATGAAIVNLSVAGPEDGLLERVISAAVRAGALVVAAAGNGGRRAKPAYPGAFTDVIAVTAVGADTRLFKDANRGDYIDLAAPGVDITTLSPGNGTVVTRGTSIAAGFVSATLALLLESSPGRDATVIRQALESTTQTLGGAPRRREFGRGLIDACGAVQRLRGPLDACESR